MEIFYDYKFVFGIISLLTGLAFIPYIKDVIQRKTEPHMYTWLIWTILQSIGSYAAFSAGGGYGSWPLIFGAFLCFVVFLLSINYGTKNVSKFDLYCLVAAIITLLSYLLLDNALLAVIMVSIIDFVGFLPTFRKGFEEPYTETVSTFMLSAFGNLTGLIALQNYSWEAVLYMGSLLFTNSTFSAMILYRRNKRK
jgi:hypothetical protein